MYLHPLENTTHHMKLPCVPLLLVGLAPATSSSLCPPMMTSQLWSASPVSSQLTSQLWTASQLTSQLTSQLWTASAASFLSPSIRVQWNTSLAQCSHRGEHLVRE